jgi:hypothetical protein
MLWGGQSLDLEVTGAGVTYQAALRWTRDRHESWLCSGQDRDPAVAVVKAIQDLEMLIEGLGGPNRDRAVLDAARDWKRNIRLQLAA